MKRTYKHFTCDMPECLNSVDYPVDDGAPPVPEIPNGWASVDLTKSDGLRYNNVGIVCADCVLTLLS